MYVPIAKDTVKPFAIQVMCFPQQPLIQTDRNRQKNLKVWGSFGMGKLVRTLCLNP